MNAKRRHRSRYRRNKHQRHEALHQHIDDLLQGTVVTHFGGLFMLNACRVVATQHIDIRAGSGALVDGRQLEVGDRVLLTAQVDAPDNGIWVVQSGSWTRPDDFNNVAVLGMIILIEDGRHGANTTWLIHVDGLGVATIGRDGLRITQFSSQGSI